MFLAFLTVTVHPGQSLPDTNKGQHRQNWLGGHLIKADCSRQTGYVQGDLSSSKYLTVKVCCLIVRLAPHEGERLYSVPHAGACQLPWIAKGKYMAGILLYLWRPWPLKCIWLHQSHQLQHSELSAVSAAFCLHATCDIIVLQTIQFNSILHPCSQPG